MVTAVVRLGILIIVGLLYLSVFFVGVVVVLVLVIVVVAVVVAYCLGWWHSGGGDGVGQAPEKSLAALAVLGAAWQSQSHFNPKFTL